MFKKYIFILLAILSSTKVQSNDKSVLRFDHDTCENRFKFADFNSPYLTELQNKFDLVRLTNVCRDDLEKMLTVMNWVNNLWRHNGYSEPVKNDPLSILEEVCTHHREFRCVEYATVTAGCLNALGIIARPLALKTADVETCPSGAGHLAVEVYLSQLNKWVMIDPQFNLMPAWNRIPLNAVELQQVLAEKRTGLQFWSMDEMCLDNAFNGSSFGVVDPTANDILGNYGTEYLEFIEKYLYYFDTPITNCRYAFDKPQEGRLMLVPIGAKEPTVFQIKYPLMDMLYTRNYYDFYPVLV